ncbi:MAG: hypothetical protein EHM33_07035 [Chloroflexi bacterium]|nr:MAG: hypothetical protein EHM33_07035 [Chloroflexota bacterium]
MLNGMPGLSSKKPNSGQRRLLAGIFILIPLLLAGFFWFKVSGSKPREAPEAERVLNAQAELPFQVLIPAYLPNLFKREKVEILTDRPGPNGEKMIQLIYSTRKGDTLTLSEWLPSAQDPAKTVSNIRRCLCTQQTTQQCNMVGMELTVGSVQIKVEFSAPNLLYYDQLQLILDTLGPATNRQVYSAIEDVPLSFSVPPPVEIPVGSDGVQEVTLVVTPEGYSPVHFAVKKDVPVRLIFRQLGQVGCGNELIFQWEERESTTLILDSATDKQILEFTPGEAGEFRFNCPHLIYRGVMTVTE